jgi:hypothetical protein
MRRGWGGDVDETTESTGNTVFSVTENPSDPAALRQEAERVALAARVEATAITEAGEQEAARLIALAEQGEAVQRERERELTYINAVAQGHQDLATAVDVWKQAGDTLEAATGQRDAARGKLSEARERVRNARQALDALTGADASLDELEAARVHVAGAESLPGLVGPSVEKAEAGVIDATEARKWAGVHVQECWDALGRLGKEARADCERPECVPDPVAVQQKEFDRRLDLLDRGRLQRLAENQQRARRGVPPR